MPRIWQRPRLVAKMTIGARLLSRALRARMCVHWGIALGCRAILGYGARLLSRAIYWGRVQALGG